MFKYLIFFIILLCACARQEIANIASRGKNIICFGDSLTFGYNVEKKDSYPAKLSEMLGINVINAGRNADTVSLAQTRLEEDVLENDPLIVIIVLGANDFLGGIPKQETFNNLRDIIRRIKSKGAMVALGQLGPFTMYTYKEEYKKLAKQENILLLENVLSGIFGNPGLMSDEVHPNKKGYAIIAKRIYKKIAPILRKNKRLRGGNE